MVAKVILAILRRVSAQSSLAEDCKIFSAIWLRPRVVFVLIGVKIDMSPTGDLLVTFFVGRMPLKLAQGLSRVELALRAARCSTPKGVTIPTSSKAQRNQNVRSVACTRI